MIDDVINKFMDMFFLIIAGFITLMVLLLVFVIGYAATGIPCSKNAEIMKYPYQFNWTNGCMLNVNGTWVSSSELVPVDKGDKIVYLPKHKTRTELEFK